MRNRWHAILTDRNVPIKMRLKAFYAHYLGATDNSNRIRIIMFAGLDGSLFARRHLETQVHGLLRQIAIEIAVEYAAAPDNHEPSAADVELVWHLHSTYVYFLVRKSIFRLQVITDTDQLIDMTVDNFIAGIASRYSPAPEIVPHENSRTG